MYNAELEKLRSDSIQNLIEDIKPKLGRRVKDHVEFGRFPYTYAYDFERCGDGSRGGTGQYLRQEYGNDIEGYAKEIVSRAFSYILSNYAEDFLWDVLDETDGTIIKDTYDFIRRNYYINMNA